MQLDSVESLILDEADEMLDLGFSEHVEEILARCSRTHQGLHQDMEDLDNQVDGTVRERSGKPCEAYVDKTKKKLQILMFSATLPSWVQGSPSSARFLFLRVIIAAFFYCLDSFSGLNFRHRETVHESEPAILGHGRG